jgi:hypothetical protein
VESIHDLSRLREEFLRHIPDPHRPVTEHHQTLSIPATSTDRFPLHALGELGKLAVGVLAGGAFDGR